MEKTVLILLTVTTLSANAATVTVDLQQTSATDDYSVVDLYLSTDEPVTLQAVNIAFNVSAGTSHLEGYNWIAPFQLRSDWRGSREFVTYSPGNYQLDNTHVLAMQLLIEPDTNLSIVDSIGDHILDSTHFETVDGRMLSYIGDTLYVPEPSALALITLGFVVCRRRLS